MITVDGFPIPLPVGLGGTGYGGAGVSGYVPILSNGAISAQIPDNGILGGNPRGANAVDLQTSRVTALQVASGANAVVIGVANAGSGIGSLAFGENNAASGVRASCLGGYNNVADGNRSATIGGDGASTRGLYGRLAWAAGNIASRGDAQSGEFVLRRQTTDATVTRLTADGTAAGSANTINLPDFGAYAGRLVVRAKAAGGQNTASWFIDISASRGSGAASTLMDATGGGAGASIAPSSSNGTGSAWRLTIAADTTNGGIAISGTGAAATTINWDARFSDAEVATTS